MIIDQEEEVEIVKEINEIENKFLKKALEDLYAINKKK